MPATQTQAATRRRNRARTREALLNAATEVFAEKGFAAATLQEISAAAGFTRGAFHHHFASKEELFLAVIARHDEELLAAYEPIGIGGLPSPPHVDAQRWHEVHSTDQDDVALRLELRALALRDPALRHRLIEVDRAAEAATADRLKDVVDAQAKVWRYPPGHIAALLHVTSGALRARAALGEPDAVDLMETMLALVWGAAIERPPAKKSARAAN